MMLWRPKMRMAESHVITDASCDAMITDEEVFDRWLLEANSVAGLCKKAWSLEVTMPG
jgi:hypothetical protein